MKSKIEKFVDDNKLQKERQDAFREFSVKETAEFLYPKQTFTDRLGNKIGDRASFELHDAFVVGAVWMHKLMREQAEQEHIIVQREDEFIRELRRTEFEYGMSNDITEMFGTALFNSPESAVADMCRMCEKYKDDTEVFSRLMQTTAYCFDHMKNYIPDDFHRFIEIGLNSSSNMVRESVLAVVEEWRTPKCLDLLIKQNRRLGSWVDEYAEKVQQELEFECDRVSGPEI